MLFALLSLLTVAAAVRVTSPTSGSAWASGTAAQTISWESVSTDPTTFVIQLVNQAGYLSNSPVTLKDGQSTSAQTTTVTYPGGTWPVGVAFQINLVTSTMANQAILAQSSQFNITNSGSAQTTGVTPTTVAGAMTTASSAAGVTTMAQQVSTSTTVTLSGDASGGIPNAAASSRSAGDKPAPSALISLLLGAAAFFGVFA